MEGCCYNKKLEEVAQGPEVGQRGVGGLTCLASGLLLGLRVHLGDTRLVLCQGSIVTTPPPLTPHTHQDNVALLLAVDRVLGIELRLSALVTVFGVRILLIEHALSFAFLTKVDLNMLW